LISNNQSLILKKRSVDLSDFLKLRVSLLSFLRIE
jgi:hypothetical protein